MDKNHKQLLQQNEDTYFEEKFHILQNKINSIKDKDINLLNFNINKKEDDIKNIINELEIKIMKEINNRYSELKSMINNIEFDIILNKLERKVDNIYQIIQNLFKIKIDETTFKFTFDVKNLFINISKDDITEIIKDKYNDCINSKKNFESENIENTIIEKLSLVLPQDIIFLMQFHKFKTQYNNIKNKIIDFYKKHEHANIFNFIKNMKYQKNIIYTFSDINENILKNIENSFNTKMFKRIKKILLQKLLLIQIFQKKI